MCSTQEARGRQLLGDEIGFSPSNSRLGGVSSIAGGQVKVCLQRISQDSDGGCLWWICSDLVVVRLRSCVFGLDPSDLRYFHRMRVLFCSAGPLGP